MESENDISSSPVLNSLETNARVKTRGGHKTVTQA